jgi:hypothetical protein
MAKLVPNLPCKHGEQAGIMLIELAKKIIADGFKANAVWQTRCKTLLAVFREPFRGGGSSPKTHNALLNLARAMQEDEAERPARKLLGRTT